MARRTTLDPDRGDARRRLLDAGRDLFRAQGFAATTLEHLCGRAAVTKGAFFHHFPNKEAFGVAVAGEWNDAAAARVRPGRHRELRDPLERVLGYISQRRELMMGELAQFTCLAGILLQEVYYSSPELREACGGAILDDAAALEADFEEVLRVYGDVEGTTAASLSRHVQAVIQGSFILAKATGDAETAREGLVHLARYIELLFFEVD